MVGRLGKRENVKNTTWYKRADIEFQTNMNRVLREQQSENLIIQDDRLPMEERKMLVRIFDWEPENRPTAEDIMRDFFNQVQ